MSKLTAKQQRFADEYLLDCNATQAAIRAGYSSKTANEQGSRLLTNVSVQKELQQRISERQKSTNITQSDILKQLTKIGFKTFEDIEIAPKDSLKALELICRLLGLDKAQQATSDNNLLDAINNDVKGEFDEVQELQQAAATDSDLVEKPGI